MQGNIQPMIPRDLISAQGIIESVANEDQGAVHRAFRIGREHIRSREEVIEIIQGAKMGIFNDRV